MALKKVLRFLGITAGVLITAVGLDVFLVPNKIAAGGVSGIATILHFTLGTPVGAAMLVLNVPIFILAIYRLGLMFGLSSLYGTIAISLAVDLLVDILPVYRGDVLLAALFGGILTGLGLGFVFKAKGTTGGTDMIAAVLNSYMGLNIGQLLFFVDGLIVLTAGWVFNSVELAMYALITIFVAAWVIDLVQEGFSYAKAFFIISDKPDNVVSAINTQLERGATILFGKGAYTGNERNVILAVVNRTEVTRLKELVRDIDRDAFVILTDVHEVLGEGFKREARD